MELKAIVLSIRGISIPAGVLNVAPDDNTMLSCMKQVRRLNRHNLALEEEQESTTTEKWLDKY